MVEQKTEAFIDGSWYTIARDRMTYNATGKRIRTENLAGQATVTAWDCCHKVSETQPDGSTTTWDYDDDGRMIASSRLIPLDMTNVTWLTTCYQYDALGRQVATWQTNYAAQVGLPATRTRYDQLGRVIASVDTLGNITTTEYSPDGRTVFVRNPNTSTTIYTRSVSGDVLSITGTAVTPEFHTYGISPDGTRWSKTVQGETASSPCFAKRYENLLGQIVREERSGFQGAVLAATYAYDSFGRLVSTAADYEPITEYTYDTIGNRVAVTKLVGRGDPTAPQSENTEWRKTETLSSFVLEDSIVWLTQTNIVSCSDSSIAPLVASSSRQLTGLTPATPARSRSTDVRGNVTDNETLVESAVVTSRQSLPYATNKPLSISRYGVPLMEVSVSAVTNTVAYDCLCRQIANTDGRGNTTHAEYNALGQRSASIDALGNRTSYAYDQFGNLAAVTNALGNATFYEYDLRRHKTLEYGATYPARYTYDIFGNKTSMTTFREGFVPDASASGDITTWLYDEASNCMTNKVYADGKGPTYGYAPDGKLAQRTWARGITTDYSYDGWGNLTNTVYSDDTPTVSLAYDAMGRQTEARDAAGLTTFAYDQYGSITNETVSSDDAIVVVTNVIDRYWDDFGRTLGYALNGTRQTTIGYETDAGRIASMLSAGSDTPFTWTYLAGSDLKSSLAYPNGLTASWTYDAKGQLLQVCNAFPTNVISQYDYAYYAAGRRINVSKFGTAFSQEDLIAYAYNVKGELTNAVSVVDSDYCYSYHFDEIGNRKTANERGTNVVYVVNSLNQYTANDDFSPQFDDDGNQTLVRTARGIWHVAYNGENRPVSWVHVADENNCPISTNQTMIAMSFDRFGRRVSKDDSRFVYNGFLQTADNGANRYVWDPTEYAVTRPLVWCMGNRVFFYSHDGDKNVSEVSTEGQDIVAHYEYSPFGRVIDVQGVQETNVECGLENRFRFSSEFYDSDIGLIYYNFRHFNPYSGRWLTRDPMGMLSDANKYLFVRNSTYGRIDRLGLFIDNPGHDTMEDDWKTDCPKPKYSREDDFWKWPPSWPFLFPGYHFQDITKSESDLSTAVFKCNLKEYQSYAHRMQDYFAHYGQGYRWYGGHILDTIIGWFIDTVSDPDDATEAYKSDFEEAKKRTREWTKLWHKCCCCKDKKWVIMAGRNESECSSNPNQERPVVHGPTKPKGLDYIGQTIEDTRDDVVDALRNANDWLQNHGVEVYLFSVRGSF